jgi:predicted nucleic acid-binding protein
VKGTALDTSVIVAALLGWHEDHERANRAVAEAIAGRERLVLPVPALIESYSAMTRLPRGYRVSPRDAVDLLRGAFEERAVLVALREGMPFSLISECAEAGIAGGAVHDAEILRCAREAGARRLLTLNARDFERFDPCGVEIVVP